MRAPGLGAAAGSGRPALRLRRGKGLRTPLPDLRGVSTELGKGSKPNPGEGSQRVDHDWRAGQFLVFAPATADADGDEAPNAADRRPAKADVTRHDADGDGVEDLRRLPERLELRSARLDWRSHRRRLRWGSRRQRGRELRGSRSDEGGLFGSDADADFDGNGTLNFVDLAGPAPEAGRLVESQGSSFA